ncbi:hypothetical protein [Mycetocola saprophilus]|uniref:hypothetical protein n=1 Tax=Mycetocola saprophilus TaxID=76636 RepID=UPI0012DDBA18|nr:hypothetical protein [Mycetocola saprophilus]
MTTPGFPNPGQPAPGEPAPGQSAPGQPTPGEPTPGWGDAAAGARPTPGWGDAAAGLPAAPGAGAQPGWNDAAAGYTGFAPGAPPTARATATFVLGLIGLIGGIVFGWGFPASIIALALAPGALRADPAGHARARRGRTLAVAGLIATALWAGYSLLRIIELVLG